MNTRILDFIEYTFLESTGWKTKLNNLWIKLNFTEIRNASFELFAVFFFFSRVCVCFYSLRSATLRSVIRSATETVYHWKCVKSHTSHKYTCTRTLTHSQRHTHLQCNSHKLLFLMPISTRDGAPVTYTRTNSLCQVELFFVFLAELHQQ